MARNASTVDFVSLERAVNDHSSRTGVLWLTFLSLAAYVAIAVGSVTHQTLLLETPIKLPILSVDLPLVGFFGIAPILFFMFHFYLLLQLVILVRKIGAYDKALREAVGDAAVRAVVRRRLDPFVIVQLLAGSERERDDITKNLLLTVTWVTLVLAPIVVLLFMQVIFLPYQLEPMIWLLRLVVGADILMIWAFWPAIRSLTGELTWRPFRRVTSIGVVSAVLTLAVATFSLFVATFPGEAIHRNIMIRGMDLIFTRASGGRLPSVSKALFEGDVDRVRGRRKSFWSSTLVVSDVDFINDEALRKIDDRLGNDRRSAVQEYLLSLRGRSLRGALFDRADLRRVDFTGAMLRGASFTSTRLVSSNFSSADLRNAKFRSADVKYARFGGAKLVAANFENAVAEGTLFNLADMQGIEFRGAKLEGAIFYRVQMQGASFAGARLHAAEFRDVLAQGANFSHSSMYGATLTDSDFRAALFTGVHAQGAQLLANFQGTSWKEAILSGAWLGASKLDGASLAGAYVWRTRFAKAVSMQDVLMKNSYRTKVGNLGNDDFQFEFTEEKLSFDPWNAEAAQNLANLAVDGVSDPKIRARIVGSLKVLQPDSVLPATDETSIKAWKALEDKSATFEARSRAAARIIEEIACRPNDKAYHGAPYAARAFVHFDVADGLGPGLLTLLNVLYQANPKTCAGAIAVDEETRQLLKDIIDLKSKEVGM